MSLNMLIEFGDAFDFTGADFAGLVPRGRLPARREVIPLTPTASAAVAYRRIARERERTDRPGMAKLADAGDLATPIAGKRRGSSDSPSRHLETQYSSATRSGARRAHTPRLTTY